MNKRLELFLSGLGISGPPGLLHEQTNDLLCYSWVQLKWEQVCGRGAAVAMEKQRMLKLLYYRIEKFQLRVFNS